MSKKKFVGCACALGILLMGLVALAQESAPAEPNKATSGQAGSVLDSEALPEALNAARVIFVIEHDGNRAELKVLGIHWSAKGSGFAFHRVVGAPILVAKPIKGLPHYVAVASDDGGFTYVAIDFLLSSPEIRSLCRDALLDPLTGDRSVALSEKRTPDDIVVQPWPLKHAIVVIRNSLTGEEIAVAQSNSLTGVHDQVRLTFKFTPETLEKFQRWDREGKIDFLWYYTFKGKKIVDGSVKTTGEVNVSLVVLEVLTSAQIDGTMPIFQGQKNEVTRRVSVRRYKVIRASNPMIIPLLETEDIALQLFEPSSWQSIEDLKSQNPEAEAQLAKYLAPLIERFKETMAQKNVTVTIHQKEKTNSGETGGGGGFLGFSLSSSSESSESDINRLQQETGVLFTKDKETGRYVPHQVAITRLKKGTDQITFDDETSIFLEVGSDNSYLEDTPIPSIFTNKVALENRSVIEGHGPYAGVPIGMAIPFFGERIPAGYLLVDPSNNWPDADWVRKELRGEPMPDMAAALMGGTKDWTLVGNVSNDPVLSVTGKANGQSFTIANPSTTEISTFGPAPNGAELWAGGGPMRGQIGNLTTAVYHNGQAIGGGVLHPRILQTISDLTVKGEATVTSTGVFNGLPRHVMARWIIRVK